MRYNTDEKVKLMDDFLSVAPFLQSESPPAQSITGRNSINKNPRAGKQVLCKICRKRCRSSQIYGYPVKFRVMTYILQSFTVLKIGFDLHLTTKMRNIRRNWWQNM